MDRPRTKQVCTIGPASADKIQELVAAGMDVARINFSHGTPDDHKAYVHAVRAAAHSARRSVAVMVDLPGPKLRLGEIEGGEARLATGSQFALRSDGAAGDTAGAGIRGADLGAKLQVGDRVLMADGSVELKVTEITAGQVMTDVVNGGLIRTRSGVNIPSERFGDGGLTDEDRAAVPRALELRVDMLAQSFVRNATDVADLKAMLPADGPRVVAKIETRAALDDFDAIAAAADGIMVARGDLGVDIPFEDVPMIQKDLLRRAADADRFTIVATQMLESMTGAARPTRAEASDVANAVLDGADAVMLSAETAIGAYPVEALSALGRICLAVEGKADYGSAAPDDEKAASAAHAIVLAAASISSFTDAGAVWCFTRTGRTAELLSMTRPRVPIVAFTLSPVVARRLAVRRGVIPLVLQTGTKASPLIDQMAAAWRGQRSSSEVESVLVVTTSSQPSGINRLEIHRLTGVGRDK
ncbi:MAG: pyruvate kinase [Chloroflexota bacterium]|jgi:pyruvate kinase|nr:pyruvate kinase [Chloroflexota bacterium]